MCDLVKLVGDRVWILKSLIQIKQDQIWKVWFEFVPIKKLFNLDTLSVFGMAVVRINFGRIEFEIIDFV